MNNLFVSKRDELDPFFDDLFDFSEDRNHSLMKTDIEDKGGNYEMSIDMPAVKKEDVKVSLDNGYLTVSAVANKNYDEKEKKGNYVRRERYYGSYKRSYYIGEQYKQEDVSAKLESGVLTLDIKKPLEKKDNETKFISIQ
ncbi:MAG: Hsp20/alpha crystallin family protein [Bacilli bacterium]